MRKRLFLAITVALVTAKVDAQYRPHEFGRYASSIIVPQTRNFLSAGAVEVLEVAATVEILEQVATTTLDVAFTNRSQTRLESQIVLPVPAGAVLRGFTFQGSAAEATAELLERDEARRTYDAIVSQVRDPALLEFLGCNLIKSS